MLSKYSEVYDDDWIDIKIASVLNYCSKHSCLVNIGNFCGRIRQGHYVLPLILYFVSIDEKPAMGS